MLLLVCGCFFGNVDPPRDSWHFDKRHWFLFSLTSSSMYRLLERWLFGL
jgi:hypothetical protein